MEDISVDDLLAAVETIFPTRPDKNPYLHYLNAKVVCLNCGKEYNGTTTRQKKWFDAKDIVYTTFFCPCCPPTWDLTTWLKRVCCIDSEP